MGTPTPSLIHLLTAFVSSQTLILSTPFATHELIQYSAVRIHPVLRPLRLFCGCSADLFASCPVRISLDQRICRNSSYAVCARRVTAHHRLLARLRKSPYCYINRSPIPVYYPHVEDPSFKISSPCPCHTSFLSSLPLIPASSFWASILEGGESFEA